MENEKNTQQQKHHGKKNHKPKSYFIEPPAKDGSTAVASPKHAEAQKPEENQRKDNDRRHHGRHNASRPKAIEQTAVSVEPTRVEAPAQNQGVSENKHHHNKKKKKHSSGKPAAEQGKQNAQTAQAISAQKDEKRSAPDGSKQQKKKYERPQSRAQGVPALQINEDDYEAVSFPPVSEERAPEPVIQKKESPLIEVVGIRFKSSGKTYYFAPNGKTLKRGEHAIVETARGLEFGEVAMGNSMVRECDTVPPLRPILRVASAEDIKHHEENKKKEDDAFTVCNQKIAQHKLDMKLIDAQFTFDNTKLLFYFTSSGRVDFRELVKDLAGVFRTRIELRQIGIRDEAKIMGGVGMCGRPLCCTLFLSDFGQVSIKMAKEQNLSLNCSKISGICGRLMCCLRYEHETYEYEIKHTPPVDSLVRTEDGNGTVTEANPLAGTVKVRLAASPENPPKLYKREDVVMLQKKQSKQ